MLTYEAHHDCDNEQLPCTVGTKSSGKITKRALPLIIQNQQLDIKASWLTEDVTFEILFK